MQPDELNDIFDTIRDNLAPYIDQKNSKNLLTQFICNYSHFEFDYNTKIEVSTKEYQDSIALVQIFIAMKLIHNKIYNRYKISKALRIPTKNQLIETKLNQLNKIIKIDSEELNNLKNTINLDDDTYILNDEMKEISKKILTLYRKNKNFLDYAFYLNIKNIFSRDRKNYWKELIGFIQLIEKNFPSLLDVHFDLSYSEVENIRNRMRGYQKRIPSEVTDIVEVLPLIFSKN